MIEFITDTEGEWQTLKIDGQTVLSNHSLWVSSVLKALVDKGYLDGDKVKIVRE